MTMAMFNFHSVTQKFKLNNINWLQYLLVGLFLIGLVFGSITVKNSDNFIIAKINEFYINYLNSKNNLDWFSLFLNTLLLTSTAIIISFFTGLCAIGIPIIAVLPFLSGSLIGVVSGYIYETYLLKGLGYCGIIIFPTAAIAVGAIIMSCKESIDMSKNMLTLLVRGRGQGNQSFKNYCIKFLVFVIIVIIAALVQTVLTKLFIGLFDFSAA